MNNFEPIPREAPLREPRCGRHTGGTSYHGECGGDVGVVEEVDTEGAGRTLVPTAADMAARTSRRVDAVFGNADAQHTQFSAESTRLRHKRQVRTLVNQSLPDIVSPNTCVCRRPPREISARREESVLW